MQTSSIINHFVYLEVNYVPARPNHDLLPGLQWICDPQTGKLVHAILWIPFRSVANPVIPWRKALSEYTITKMAKTHLHQIWLTAAPTQNHSLLSLTMRNLTQQGSSS
jgi:hypothetical protein